jgi:predicted nuclease of predicted toxin-antitoxin system
MKFKVDENLPIEVAELLQQAGYDVATVYEQNLVGEIDANIATVCRSEKRAIVTLDLDFGDIRSYPPEEYSGIIVMRLKQQDKPYVLNIVKRWIKTLSSKELEGHLWIVDESQIRIRS